MISEGGGWSSAFDGDFFNEIEPKTREGTFASLVCQICIIQTHINVIMKIGVGGNSNAAQLEQKPERRSVSITCDSWSGKKSICLFNSQAYKTDYQSIGGWERKRGER